MKKSKHLTWPNLSTRTLYTQNNQPNTKQHQTRQNNMLINKLTEGYVRQVFDTETDQFVSQDFVAGDDVSFESGGDTPDVEQIGYLTFDMVQPRKDDPPRTNDPRVDISQELQFSICAVVDAASGAAPVDVNDAIKDVINLLEECRRQRDENRTKEEQPEPNTGC